MVGLVYQHQQQQQLQQQGFAPTGHQASPDLVCPLALPCSSLVGALCALHVLDLADSGTEKAISLYFFLCMRVEVVATCMLADGALSHLSAMDWII